MSRRSTTVPRSSIFTLEDGTWVVQRGVDRVQELLTREERTFSSLDVTYEITDPELDILMAQGIIEQYDDFFVWLTSEMVASALLESPLGITIHYYVQTGLDSSYLKTVRERLERTELSDRYEVSERFGLVIVTGLYEEPFSHFRDAEDAQILLAPALQELSTRLTIEMIRFDTADITFPWPDTVLAADTPQPLIRKLAPVLGPKHVVCIDKDQRTHQLVEQICVELGVEIASAFNGKDGMTLIQDTDPALIIMELTLPDLHGYEIVAFVRNNPELAHIPIIIVSSLNSESDRALAFTVAKVKDYAIKPLKANEIRRRIWQLLNQRVS